MSDLVGNPEDRFSHNEAHMITTIDSLSLYSADCIMFLYQLMWAYYAFIHFKLRIMIIGTLNVYEPRHEKTGFLHMQKQRRRSASR